MASRLQGANIFSILDAKSGLDEESSLLSTFSTPVGHYRFARLPVSVKCAPEIFQRIMDQMERDETTHDERLTKFLERASKKGLKLNKEKCKIHERKVPYVGHLLIAEGLKIDPQKVKAIHEMPEPKTKGDVRRLLGFVQFLSRYLPKLSTVDAPLPELEKSDVLFHWEYPQKESFRTIKQLVL